MDVIYRIIHFVRKLMPAWAFRLYHFLWAFVGHLVYGFPSNKLIVIGVTGTKGKTTTAAALAHILQKEGFKVAVSTSAFFQIGEKREENTLKVGMPGRFFLSRLLSRAVQASCQVAIIESTSEGVLQYRHRFINYDFFIFTNLRPEHIERHGSFEKYKEAKLELFRHVASSKEKDISKYQNIEISKGVVVNLDDEAVGEFLEAVKDVQSVGVTIGGDGVVYQRSNISMEQKISNFKFQISNQAQSSNIQIIQCFWENGGLIYQDQRYGLRVPGKFNAYNIVLASATATLVGVPFEKALEYSKDFPGVSGRFEVLRKGKVAAVIDYAHEPFSLEEVLKLTKEQFPGKLIHIFGATGGGRDIWKRPKMGEIAERYADHIILTNDDPYDEDQMGIVKQILQGIQKKENTEVILDRRQAIEKGIWLVKDLGGVVLVTGKGSETVQCLEKGKRIPWSDRGVVEEKFRS